MLAIIVFVPITWNGERKCLASPIAVYLVDEVGSSRSG